jgi:outer membrane protein
MKQMIQRLMVLVLLLTAAKGKTQEALQNSFSLQQAIDYALKNSPSQQNAQLDLQSAEYRKQEITGMGLPQVNGSFDVKDYLKLPVSVIDARAFNPMLTEPTYTTITFGVKYNATAGVSVSQLLFSSDYIFGLKASSEFMNLSRMNLNRNKAEVIAAVSKAYYNVLINQERIKLLESNITRIEKTFNDTKAFNQQGFAEKIDVERLEVAFNNLVSEKTKVLKLIGLTESLLKFQMGYKISEPITLTDKINTDEIDGNSLSGANIDITRRPDYKMLQAQQTLLNLDVKRLQWGYLPTLAGYGAFQLITNRPTANIFETDENSAIKRWYRVGLIGLTLNMNLFDGMQRHYKIQQAKMTALKNTNTLRNLELAAELEATVASISYDNAVTSVSVQKKNLELAQHVYDVSQKKYLSGVGSNLEVVTAETSLKEAQTNYLNALYDMVVAKIDYLKATGGLTK